ncbi:hypothetical protein V6Z11_D01G033200 [Gossypium hirsutum]
MRENNFNTENIFIIPEGVIWNGRIYIGLINVNRIYFDGFYVVADDVEKIYYETYEYSTDSRLIYFELESDGRYLERIWDAGKGDWINGYSSYLTDCDVYGKCGAFGICDSTKRPICSCLKGFKPRNIEEWSRGKWSSGCFRTTPLHCQRENNNGSEAGQGDDGFLKLKKMKVPNCSCVAYAYDAGIGCMLWSGDLIVSRNISLIGESIFTFVCHLRNLVNLSSISTMCINLHFWFRCFINHVSGFADKGNRESSIGVKLQQPPLFNFQELATATNNFHPPKKLGQGGFGPVYKGTLDDGKEIAVKRLSKASGQGLEEFMNEVVVISKLQHRNLVRLFGCCVEAEEKILVYEFMPNKSLDAFLFDFGMARIFGGDENQANTKRAVGTYGYMSPEYAMQGQFSEKSDVFSYGVLLLEIVSGRRNTSFYNNKDDLSLLGYAWKLWREGNIWGLVDNVILESKSYSNNEKEIWRCIHVGLLCVQEYTKDRPTISTVISMLNSEISDLNTPKQPAFTQAPQMSHDVEDRGSLNDVTLTNLDGR